MTARSFKNVYIDSYFDVYLLNGQVSFLECAKLSDVTISGAGAGEMDLETLVFAHESFSDVIIVPWHAVGALVSVDPPRGRFEP